MRQELAGTDAYLEEWNKAPAEEREGDAETVAKQVADEIEGAFAAIRDAALN